LHAVDGALHRRIEILDAQADAVEALAAQGGDALRRDRARIDFDRELALVIGGEIEVRTQGGQQLVHLPVRQVGRRAAAEVQLVDPLVSGQQRALHGNLAIQVMEVFDRLAVILRDDLVATAVVAQRRAKRDMHIQRQRRAVAVRIEAGDRVPVLCGAEAAAEAVGGRIRRVARTRLVELAHQRGIEFHRWCQRNHPGGWRGGWLGVGWHGRSPLSKACPRSCGRSTTT
jgi:hypothetical protein